MPKVSPRTLSGFMELLPDAQMKMERMMEVLRQSYGVYGFTPLDTPVIDKEELTKVFERFFQAKCAASGTGIGLALVKSFVELHQHFHCQQ